MRSIRSHFWGTLLIVSQMMCVAQAQLPEIPARLDSVAPIVDGKFVAPQLPPMRLSADGRIGLTLFGGPQIHLLTPEKLTAPFILGAAGTSITNATAPNVAAALIPSALTRNQLPPEERKASFRALCDSSPAFGGTRQNPFTCGPDGSSDCYRLTILQFIVATDTTHPWVELWGTPVNIRVENPKTAQAKIVSIVTEVPVLGAHYAGMKFFFEPMVTDDGRLLVGRMADSALTWRKDDGTSVSGIYDMVYSVGTPGANPCDVRQWQNIFPITHAPFHQAMRSGQMPRYGFAAFPFRDTEGNLIPDGAELKGTYPWIDRRGSVLFFTAVPTTLHYRESVSAQTLKTRYPSACVPGVVCDDSLTSSSLPVLESSGNTRGVSFLGLWTKGKAVLLDGPINHLDYGLRSANNMHRMLQLYSANTGPTNVNQSGWIRTGSGRDNGPLGNTTFIESVQSIFNYNKFMAPLLARDVVWLMNTGHGTSEVAFDDYINQNALIVSDMVPSMSHTSPTFPAILAARYQHYHDGFHLDSDSVGSGFKDPIRMQNAATTLELNVPAYGAVVGPSRAEPVALGGVHGKGFWLNGANAIRYSIPAQDSAGLVATKPWFSGLFIDPRFADDDVIRRLLSFPDGSSVSLAGRRRIVIRSSANEVLALDLATALPAKRWSHLGFLTRPGGTRVEVFLNGMVIGSRNFTGGGTFLRPTAGNLSVGLVNGVTPFRGWIDEFRVFAEDPNPELICNYARGTIVGLTTGYTGRLQADAALTPEWAHQRISGLLTSRNNPAYAAYACYHDYNSSLGVSASRIPAGTASVRSNLLFPEGPLEFGMPRPDSRQNQFCRTCHVAGHHPILSLDALAPRTVNMEQDPRRQPFQPRRRLFGLIPADLFGPGKPANDIDAGSGILVDRFINPTLPIDPDFDGVSTKIEIQDGSNPADRGSFREHLSSPVYTPWNGFLQMSNILELINTSGEAATVSVTLLRIDGSAGRPAVFPLAAHGQFDVIVNALDGFSPDSYGMLEIVFNQAIDGRMSFYRHDTANGKADFAFAVPLSRPSRGMTAVGFNTFQPSLAARDANLAVHSWLTIANLSAADVIFTVRKFAQNGAQLSQADVQVRAFGRLDLEAGHQYPGPGQAGLLTITPRSNDARYLASLARYGNGAAGRFEFAFALQARAPNGEEMAAPILRSSSEQSWLEVASTVASAQEISVYVHGQAGQVLKSWTGRLNPFGQVHIEVSDVLTPGEAGMARVAPSLPASVVSQVVTYSRGREGEVLALYPTPLRESFGDKAFSSYNLFLGMENVLLLANPSPAQTKIAIGVHGPSAGGENVLLTSKNVTLAPFSSTRFDLHDSSEFGTRADTYGVITFVGTTRSAILAQLVRRKAAAGQDEFLMPAIAR